MKIQSIFDSHAHYDDERFDIDRDKILKDLPDGGVKKVCNVAADLNSCKLSLDIAEKYPYVYVSSGVHPYCVNNLEKNWIEVVEEYSKHDKVVAIGEAGLDYHYPDFNKKNQWDAFEKQLQLAKSMNLPVIVHSRDAAQDTLDVLKNFSGLDGVVHCFSGSAQIAEKLVSMGFYIGFTGVITFKNAKKAVQAAQVVPDDRLLIETDCPYMAPEPWRGKRCDSLMLTSVLEKLAEIKNCSAQEIANITYKNACDLYKITY